MSAVLRREGRLPAGRTLQIVRETAARGGIVLIATHDPERSSAVVDGVLRLREGRVVEEAVSRPEGIRLAAEGAR